MEQLQFFSQGCIIGLPDQTQFLVRLETLRRLKLKSMPSSFLDLVVEKSLVPLSFDLFFLFSARRQLVRFAPVLTWSNES